MPENIVEYVTVRAPGIADVEKQIEKLEKQTRLATNQSLALAQAMTDPRYQRAVKLQADARQAAEGVTRSTSLRARMESVSNGEYAKRLTLGRSVLAQTMAIEQAERRVQLQMQLGKRLGGGAFAVERAIASPAGKLASGASLGVLGAATAGFSGTVEMRRFTNELTFVSRELAGALKPALDGTTYVLRKVRGVLEGLDRNGQNVILGFASIYAAQAAYTRLMGQAAAVQAASSVATGAGTALAGGAAARAAGGATAAGGSSWAWRNAGRALRFGGKVVAPAVMANDAYVGLAGEETWYAKNRRAGSSKLRSGLQAAGSSFGSLLSFGWGNDSLEREIAENARGHGIDYKIGDEKARGPNAERRQTWKSDSGFDAIGSGYERMANAAALAYGDSTKAAEKEHTEALNAHTAAMVRYLDSGAMGPRSTLIEDMRGR